MASFQKSLRTTRILEPHELAFTRGSTIDWGRMDSDISSALIVAVVGGVVAGGVGSGLLWLHDWLEKRRARKSLACALLWEIDDFYKLSIRNVIRALKDKNPEDLGFNVKTIVFNPFTVYEGSADKVGLFEPLLVQSIVSWYGNVRAYLNTVHDYGQTFDQIVSGQNQLRKKAVTLLGQMKRSAESFVPLTRTVCEGLAVVAGVSYKFDVP